MTQSTKCSIGTVAGIATTVIIGAIAYGVAQAQIVHATNAIVNHGERIGKIEVVQARQDARWESIRDSLQKIERHIETTRN